MIKLLSCNRTTWGAAQTLGRAQAWWESGRKLGRDADPQSHAAWTDKRWLDRKAYTVYVVLVLQLNSAEVLLFTALREKMVTLRWFPGMNRGWQYKSILPGSPVLPLGMFTCQ